MSNLKNLSSKNSEKIKQAYGAFLEGQNYTHFSTFTTRREMTINSARRNMERFFYTLVGGTNGFNFNYPAPNEKRINQSGKKMFLPSLVPEKNLNLNSLMMFWVAEPFDCKEGFHTHALLSIDNKSLSYKDIFLTWQKTTGEHKTGIKSRVQIEKIIPRLGACYYIGKYLLKNNCDYDLLTYNKKIT